MEFLLGADPEMFLKKEEDYISGYNIIPGTKMHPFKLKRGAVQVDGMALEINIDPVNNEDDFVLNINSLLSTLRKMIPANTQLDISPIAMFPKGYIRQQPLEARILGCDIDFNAWTGWPNDNPRAHPNMRTAAGHLHIGWTEKADINDLAHIQSCCVLGKQLDVLVGCPSILEDTDTKRRKMYGKAGAFRPKSYGMEYRVLSNYWLKSEELIRKIYKRTHLAYQFLVDGNRKVFEEIEELGIDVQNTINSFDKKAAAKVCTHFSLEV